MTGQPSSDADDRGYYWSLDVPGLSERQLSTLTDWLGTAHPELQVISVDPSWLLTMHMDRATVETIRAALAAYSDARTVANLIGLLDDWLAQAH